MTRSNANRLKRIRRLPGLLAAELLALGKSALLPWAECCWHSTQDFVQLTVTGDNLERSWQRIDGALMRIERRLEAPLPESWRHRRPLKTILMLALLLLLVYLSSGESSIEDLGRSGELRVISRESPTTPYRVDEQPAGPEYDYPASFADFLGVENRLDAAQSIMGGAGYLSRLERRIADSLSGEDRWWFALAASSIGMGHLRDARRLAEQLDLDPDSRLDLRGVLPLLSQKEPCQHLEYGRARGEEPVSCVLQVRITGIFCMPRSRVPVEYTRVGRSGIYQPDTCRGPARSHQAVTA